MVEDAKKVLFLYANKVSQVVKDVLLDLHMMKKTEAVKFSRKNEECRPFEVGGETRLEFYASKTECGLFALGSHSKKRPHNMVLGRLFDGRLYDCLELGVEGFKSIRAFGNTGTGAGLGAKPCIVFVGEKFDSVPGLKLARSLLLDMFRGETVATVNLAGVDRVVVATALEDAKAMTSATADVQKEALVQPRLGKRKEKNVASDNIEGKVGRMYMPKQKV
ncbi:brix domain-containing protein, partial [Haematococcus lacustris]